MPSEVERVALEFEGAKFAKAIAKHIPITSQHVELTGQSHDELKLDVSALKIFLAMELPEYMIPERITLASEKIRHRFKRS